MIMLLLLLLSYQILLINVPTVNQVLSIKWLLIKLCADKTLSTGFKEHVRQSVKGALITSSAVTYSLYQANRKVLLRCFRSPLACFSAETLNVCSLFKKESATSL